MSKTHCKRPNSTTPSCLAERAREFAAARNAEAAASIARVKAERERTFAAARNAEINASIARVAAERTSLAMSKTHCKRPNSTTPSCLAERAREFAAARNAEINASIARVKAERARAFAAARNAEINASIAAYEQARRMAAQPASAPSSVETGAIEAPALPGQRAPARNPGRPLRSSEVAPCREAMRPVSALPFAQGSAALDAAMTRTLDRVAMIAMACPAVRIGIHGHADASGPIHVNRGLAERRAQAALDYLVAAGVEPRRFVVVTRAPSAADSRTRGRGVEFNIADPAMSTVARRVMWDLSELLDPTYVPPVARLSP